jgi:hypothetical protein
MRKFVAVWTPLIAAAAAVLAFPADTEAGLLFRRHRQCPPPVACCPPPMYYQWPGPVYPQAIVPPAPLPSVRVVTLPNGKQLRLIARGLPHKEELDEQPSAFEAKAGPDEFNGKSRKVPKTSYVEGKPEEYASVKALKTTVFTKAKMRDEDTMVETMAEKMIPWGRQKGADGPEADRIAQEKKNVTVTAYIYAFKYEKDHDFHVLIGDAPGTPGLQYLNSEVSGLPKMAGPVRDKLRDVRTKFKERFGLGPTGPHSYEDLENPQKVRITGSLFYDLDHSPPREFVGYSEYQPKTAWEIHPITDIEFLED